MIIPIRCFSCGKVIAIKKNIKNPKEQIKKLKRYCCKRMLLTNVELFEILN